MKQHAQSERCALASWKSCVTEGWNGRKLELSPNAMGRAEDLFRRISEGGEGALDQLILERQSEELFLEFKRSADNGAGPRLNDTDRSHFAKAISGFGNSEGGVIVWGVECSPRSDRGDVASAKVLLQNPHRFVSWLEGAVSGCTVPPHPQVRSLAIESSQSGSGFAVTYVAKSHLAPHHCIHPPQFYIRAGSGFAPAPYSVLAGMFGRRPQPFVFHMWAIAAALIEPGSDAAVFSVGFMIGNHGPGLARDLYVNLRAIPPGSRSTVKLEVPDRLSWTGQHAFGAFTSLVSVDSFKLAPMAFVEPLIMRCKLAPPFEREFFYEFTFGEQNSPIGTVSANRSPQELQRAYDDLAATSSEDMDGRRRFVSTVMGIKDSDVSYRGTTNTDVAPGAS